MMQSKDLDLLRLLRKKIAEQNNLTKPAPTEGIEEEIRKDQEQELRKEGAQPPNNPLVGFVLHCFFKVAVFMLFMFRGIFSTVVNGLVINQFIAVFAVFDFWFTKNVTGKRLLGVRWYFDTDEWGTEKFFFECRANDQHIDFMWNKLFWIIQIVYTFIPFVVIIGGFIQAFYVLVNLELIVTSVGIMVAGGSNLFFFFQANSAAHLKQKELKRKLAKEDIEHLKFATVYSYT